MTTEEFRAIVHKLTILEKTEHKREVRVFYTAPRIVVEEDGRIEGQSIKVKDFPLGVFLLNHTEESGCLRLSYESWISLDRVIGINLK